MATPAAIFADPSGVIQFWNSGMTELFGFGPDEAIGASLHQILPAFGAWCGLSRRGNQVLGLVAGGLAAKQMARRLDLSSSP